VEFVKSVANLRFYLTFGDEFSIIVNKLNRIAEYKRQETREGIRLSDYQVWGSGYQETRL